MDMIAILVDRIEEMATGLIRALPQFAIALVVLIVTWLAAKLARRLAAKAMARTQIRPGLATLVKTLVTVLVWIVGILLALAVLLPGVTAASLLAVLGLGSVAIGFAFKDIFENFLAGVLIMLRRQMRIGDVIECEGITGKVEHITLRETHVRKLSNEVTIVPN
ncbi:MAG: mechanosensitive ion channel family protein [Sphingomonadaceae bacterium]